MDFTTFVSCQFYETKFFLQNKCEVIGLGKLKNHVIYETFLLMKETTIVIWGPPKVSNKYQKKLELDDAFFWEHGWENVILKIEIILALCFSKRKFGEHCFDTGPKFEVIWPEGSLSTWVMSNSASPG